MGDASGDIRVGLFFLLRPGLRVPEGVFIDGLVALVETERSEPSSIASLSFKLALTLSNDAVVCIRPCTLCTLAPPVTR